ncbi:MAG: hypothetical protein KIS78_08450 [Labilithrix sp.]|nr:hypothetical protein [Labilithrix sp.]
MFERASTTRIAAPSALLAIVLGLWGCGGRSVTDSEFAADRRVDGSKSARGRVTDSSVVAGPCEFIEPDASPLGSWECPPPQHCVDMSTFDVVGSSCRDGSCPVCVTDLNLAGYVSCDDPARALRFVLTDPPRVVCSD